MVAPSAETDATGTADAAIRCGARLSDARKLQLRRMPGVYGLHCGHGYFTQAPDLPEALAAWRETIHHFNRYLGL